MKNNKVITFMRTWKLPVAMVAGILLYYVFRALPLSSADEDTLYYIITHMVQPTLIFSMLFLSFLRVSPRDLRPHRWHGILLTVQAVFFIVCSMLAYCCDLLPKDCAHSSKLMMESAMLCFICPTATASVVIVRKLGGSMSGIVTYLMLCNVMVAFVAPMFMPLVEPHGDSDFLQQFLLIMGKVFPLLLCPLYFAVIVRHYMPRLKERLLSIPDLAFYMWLVALPLAITVTVRTIYASHISIGILLGMAAVSLASCLIQFYLGRHIGSRWIAQKEIKKYGMASATERSAITAGQAFGQKNTVFVIWLGLMFLDPITSVVGGCYSIWHNMVNSWQLYKSGKK